MTHRPPEPPRLRAAVERTVAGQVAWLGQRRGAAFVGVLVLAIATFAVPGALSLLPGLLLLVLLGTVSYLSWPLLTARGRVARSVVLTVVVVLVVAHALV